MFARAERLYWNCLKMRHQASRCYSASRCKVCSNPYHTLINQTSATVANKAPSSITTEEVSLATYEYSVDRKRNSGEV